MRILGIVLALLGGACIRSSTTTCADGTLCREGTVCAPAGERTLCATPEQLSACENLTAGDACGSDRCYEIDAGLVCWPIACGNGFVDQPQREQCDDGNTVSEDGCSADCFSNETCGNGIIDSLFGEQCDDGNFVSHDGCSSRCDHETSRWVRREDGYIDSNRAAMAMTFDVRRGRVVIFGGVEPGPGGGAAFPMTTAEWDGVYSRELSMTAPEGREDPALAYDDRRGVSVLFGGRRATGVAADTWEWSGSDWAPVDASGPAGRSGAAFAYDTVRERMVLFGGRDEIKERSDAWALENGVWAPLPDGPDAAAISSPPTMTFDPVAGVIVLITNRVQWELAGSVWKRLGSVPGIDMRPMWIVFDTGLQKRLLLGDDGSGMLKTWAWDGSVWTELSRATISAGTIRSIVADRVHGGLIVARVPGWARWSPAGQLTLVDDPVFVDPRIATGAAAANDLARRLVVQFGGNRGTRTSLQLTNDTYIFDGRTWTMPTVTNAPSPRWEHAMAYDVARDRIVLFGGETSAGLSAETWLWDGATWTRAMPLSSPSARAHHAMAFDPGSGRVVVFGGRDAAGASNETWEWDGQTWTSRSTPNGLTPRLGAALAHDPNGGGLILFGGGDATGPDGRIFDDTWRLTSVGWTLSSAVLFPTARRAARLTWAPARRRLLLTGGERVDTFGVIVRDVVVDDTWEWDGARWRPLFASPRAVTQHVAFASPDGTTVMTLGGNTLDSTGAAWLVEHRWADVGAYETCTTRHDADGDGLAACADPDCWSSCSPLCAPATTSCPMSPSCGDGNCSSLETVQTCPSDCGAAPVMCGDLVCDPSETCTGECP